MSLLSLASALTEDRKKKPKGRPHASRASKGDAAPVILDDLMDESQPQSCSAFLRREEGVEDLVSFRRGDACSGVSDLQLSRCARELAERTEANPYRRSTQPVTSGGLLCS